MFALYFSSMNCSLWPTTFLVVCDVIYVTYFGRRENLKIHGVPESTKSQDDEEKAVIAVAKELNVSNDKQIS